jgi:LAO/AO transport system kinase
LTVASLAKGVPELVDRFEQHLAWLGESGTLERRRRQRVEQRLEHLVREQLWRQFREAIPEAHWQRALATLADRRETPNRLAERLMAAGERPARGN